MAESHGGAGAPEPAEVPEHPLVAVRRWEDSGGLWEVLARTASGGVVLALLTCTGGEEMGRIVSADPELLDHLRGRRRSDDPEPD